MLLSKLVPENTYMILSRRTLILVSGVFFTLALGAASVHATPVCQRLVRTYREKLVRNRVSRATQARWSVWNKAHPDFHPKPRAKYKLTSEELIQKMDFDCQVPVDPVELASQIVPIEPVGPPADLFPPPTLPSVTQVATMSTPVLSFVPLNENALAPPNIAPVPEVSSLVFALTGAVFLVLQPGFCKRRLEQL